MAIYHIQDDSDKIIRLLPDKKLFIMDLYNTMVLISKPFSFDDALNARDFLGDDALKLYSTTQSHHTIRDGTIDFLRFWKQKKVIFTDADEKDAISDMKRIGVFDYFSHIYSKKDLTDYGKDYARIPQLHGFSVDETIVIEDLDLRCDLDSFGIDMVVIPTIDSGNIIDLYKDIIQNYRHSFYGLIP